MAPQLKHSPSFPVPSFSLRLGAALLWLAMPALVQAQSQAPATQADNQTVQNDAFNYVLGAALRYEDNLFRLASSNQNNLPGGASVSDRIATASAGIRFDKAYSLQQLQLDVTANHFRYEKNRALDFTGVDYRAAWLWQVTPHVAGTLSADRTQRSADYAYYTTGSFGTRNKQTIENRNFTIDGALDARWHLVGGLHQNRLRNDLVFNPVGNYRLDTGEAGVRYGTPADNSAMFLLRTGRGEYDRSVDPTGLFDKGFDQHEAEARVTWHASAHSILNGRIGYVERKHNHFSQRDFSGTVGQLDYTWLPTAKTQVLFSLIRDMQSYQESSNSYYVLDGFVISPTWQVSAKTTLRAHLDLNRRDFRGAITSVSTMREDRNRLISFGAEWHVSRNGLITASIQHERRTSNFTGLDYTANVAMLTGQIAF